MRVGVIGLGKLGLPFTLLLAEAGFDVLGIDTDPEHLARLRRGEVPHHEAGLAQMLDDHGVKVDWRSDPGDAAECDVAFVVVPTPSLPSGAFDVSMVESAVASVGEACRNGVSHVLCVVSTTNPGDCGGRIAQVLTTAAGRELGGGPNDGGLGLAFSPEFIALGDVFAGMRRPDLLLIGESESWAGDRVSYVLRSIRSWGPGDLDAEEAAVPHVAAEHRLSLTEAEIAKLSVNAFITTKVAFANSLGELVKGYGCRQHPVAAAVGADSRIGTKYLRPGPPYGGPCFPRDQRAWQAAAAKVGVEVPLSVATHDYNADMVRRFTRVIRDLLPIPAQIAVLGLTYKPGTAVTTEAYGALLAEALWALGYDVNTYDPLAESTHDDIDGAIDGAHLIIRATDDPAIPGSYAVPCIDAWADE